MAENLLADSFYTTFLRNHNEIDEDLNNPLFPSDDFINNKKHLQEFKYYNYEEKYRILILLALILIVLEWIGKNTIFKFFNKPPFFLEFDSNQPNNSSIFSFKGPEGNPNSK